MCRRGETEEVIIDDKSISIDRCLAYRVRLPQHKRIRTLGCCCGHNRYRRTIVIWVDGHIEEFFSGKIIPRKTRFYQKDSKGYYYIPEVEAEVV
jgi:hypothetical protein